MDIKVCIEPTFYYRDCYKPDEGEKGLFRICYLYNSFIKFN